MMKRSCATQGAFGGGAIFAIALACCLVQGWASVALADDAMPVLIRAKKIYLSPGNVVSPGAILGRATDR